MLPDRNAASGKCRVFIIDDHPVMREGLIKVISTEPDFEFCGELGEGKGAVDVVLQAKPDVILLDLTLQDCSGLELIKDFRAAGIDASIFVLSMHDEALYAERVLRAGGSGYLMKEENPDLIVEGIRTLMSGEVFLSDRMKSSMLHSLAGRNASRRESNSLSALSDREFEVFELIGRGNPTRDISQMLGISPKTVDAHRAHIKEKLGFASGAQLLRYAVRWVETGATEVGAPPGR